MALISFINKNTYKIEDELEDYIYCDYEISYAIANLNKKGYKTRYSCAGHNEVGLYWPTHKLPLTDLEEYLKEAKKDKSLHFINQDDKYFYHKDEKVKTWIYISFDKNYNFETIPDGFSYELVNGNSYIIKEINFYKNAENTIRKKDNEINRELDESRFELNKWVDILKKFTK